MNTLSWFLYFADVAHSFSITLWVISLIGAVASTIFAITAFGENEPEAGRLGFKFLVGFTTILLLNTAIPSKDTLYAIAASELGEQVIKSDTGEKINKAILTWIDSKLEAPSKSK